MTNPLALILGMLLVGAMCFDIFMNDTQNLLFLAKKFADMIEWVAFWR
ncbi:MAG: hypothetical protein ACI9KK_002041 [Ascidiaceihabitans sp.]|jgi:hypothetical protein